MPQKKVIAFFDGQNLYHSAKNAFGYTHPNYDPKKLASAICKKQNWRLMETRFYTGVPKKNDVAFWHNFWTAKIAKMNRTRKVFVFSRSLQYRTKTFNCCHNKEDCLHNNEFSAVVGDEKGIDVRIAIDIIALGFKKQYDIALVFSQDQDLSEVAKDIRDIANIQNRFIKIASAFPVNPQKKHLKRGIDQTDWIRFDKKLYDECIDSRDYRK